MIASYDDLVAAVVKWLKDPKLADIAPDLITLSEAKFRRTIKFHDREGSTVLLALAITPPTLGNLTLSSPAFIVNTPISAAILGKTVDSVVTVDSSDHAALSVGGSVLSGTFTTLGTPVITLTETLAGAANTPHVSDSITVSVVNHLVISGTPPAGRVGDAYDFTPTVTGGYGVRSFQLTGALLAGLSFNVATGAITGTPTVSGVMSLTISVADQIDTDSHAVSINVADVSHVYAQYAAILEDF